MAKVKITVEFEVELSTASLSEITTRMIQGRSMDVQALVESLGTESVRVYPLESSVIVNPAAQEDDLVTDNLSGYIRYGQRK